MKQLTQRPHHTLDLTRLEEIDSAERRLGVREQPLQVVHRRGRALAARRLGRPLLVAVRPRAVNPTTCTQSSSASSRRSNRATRASTSCVWCAMPSTRYGSYSRGLTNRRSRNPKFLSARTTWAMLTRSWGSWSTTTIIACPHKRASAECGIRNAEWQGEVRYRRAVHSALASSHQLQGPDPLRS